MEQVCAKRIACLVDLYSFSGPDGLQLKHKVTGVAPAFQLFPMVLLTLGALKYAVTEGNTAYLEGDPRGRHCLLVFFELFDSLEHCAEEMASICGLSSVRTVALHNDDASQHVSTLKVMNHKYSCVLL